MVEIKAVRADVQVAGGIDRTSQRPDDGAQGEGDDFHPARVDPQCLRRQFVLANGAHGAPQGGVAEPPDQAGHQEQGPQREPGIPLGRGEREKERRAFNIADSIRAARDRDPVGGDQGVDDLEADRHHRQVVAADLEGRTAEPRTRQGSGEQTKDESEPPVDP